MSARRLGSGALVLVAASLSGAASWTIDAVPAPTRPQPLVDLINAIACPTSRVCVATGLGPDGPLVERWNGRRWKRQRARFGQAGPAAVSCSSPRACTVVTNVPLALRWDGSRWRRQRMPGALGGGDNFSSDQVSCPAARVCFAVSSDDEGEDATTPVIERWNGRRWSVMKIRLRTRAGDSFLDRLSCASPTACVALGQDGLRSPLVERWDGSRWSLQHISRHVALRLLSCPTATACLALGDDGAERWDGRRWSRTRAPRLGKSIFLDALACSRPKACIAIGTSGTRTGPERFLAERWNGRRWSLQRPLTPQTWVRRTTAWPESTCRAPRGGPVSRRGR